MRKYISIVFIAAAWGCCCFAEDKPVEKPKPRAARSVHLGYPLPESAKGKISEVELFYNEATVEQSTSNTYFMACGFSAGYFGIQELGGGKKVVIFSVWDPGKQDDPNSVKSEDRVKVLFEGEGVKVSRFGGEGTGGKSMFAYDWKINETQKFLVKCAADGKSSTFTAWFWLSEKKEWKKLATFQTMARGTHLKGLYSFVEDFRRDGKSVDEVRRARFGNGWVKTLDGEWLPLLKAKFTGDATQLENNDAGAVAESNDFYLATGGEAKRTRGLNSVVERGTKNSEAPGVPEEVK
jgi:hypothetical protein